MSCICIESTDVMYAVSVLKAQIRFIIGSQTKLLQYIYVMTS